VNLGVLASHEGTTLQALIDASTLGTLPARIATVICNNAEAGALKRAAGAGIVTHHLSGLTHPDPDALDAAICAALVAHDVELVVLAGYMRKLGPRTLARFRGGIVNTHPARLPKFGGQGMYGLHVHRAVLAAGEATTGASVHLVDEEYDTGRLIAQREVPVLAGDTPETLAERVQHHERALLVDVLTRVADGRLRLTD
jgi:phosphoribosylglycinamide formyltransferase 1